MADGLRTYRDAVAIVTGAGSGIGAALSRALAGRGARVVVVDRHRESAGETARAIEQSGGRAEAMEVDVRDAEGVAKVIGDAHELHRRIDYLFNNAGIGVAGEVLQCSLDDWRYIFDVNVMGVVHGVQAAYPRMVGQGFGHIISTASMAGLMATPFTAAYGATKAAVVGLMRALRIEAEPYGVRASALCPGVIRTPALSGGRYGRIKFEMSVQKQLENWERLHPMDPAVFAERVLDQVAANREIIIVPSWWRLIWWMNRFTPGLSSRFARRMYEDMKKRVEGGG
jgi:NAD(P)-dependent dehydrogenase (short-subunit alcohol dehydrogenase family)